MNDDGKREPQIDARPKNFLVPIVLLMLRQRNSYGYELMNRVADFGLGALGAGTIYRMLKKMEKEGMVRSEWEASEGPARRRCFITEAGEKYLDVQAEALKQYQRNVDAFFDVYLGKKDESSEKPL